MTSGVGPDASDASEASRLKPQCYQNERHGQRPLPINARSTTHLGQIDRRNSLRPALTLDLSPIHNNDAPKLILSLKRGLGRTPGLDDRDEDLQVELARVALVLVGRRQLEDRSARHELGDLLLLGWGEERVRCGVRRVDDLEDALVEAVVAAVQLDFRVLCVKWEVMLALLY